MKNKSLYAGAAGLFVVLNTFAFQNCSRGKFQAVLIPNAETRASSLGDPTLVSVPAPVVPVAVIPTPSEPVPNLLRQFLC